jgi:hypothetical protein
VEARGEGAIAGAQLVLVHERAEGSCRLTSDEHGRFASPVLPAGRVRLQVQAEGRVTTAVDLELPHRGEWSSFVVRLESLRDRALSPFRRLSMRVLPSARAWGVWTNREARAWLLQRLPADDAALGELTADVERACYGSDLPSEREVASIEQRTRAIEASLEVPSRPARTRAKPERESPAETPTVR